MECYDVAVIGGGIVGVATAKALTEQAPGTKVIVLEKEAHLAAHQTGNNSGVIHSGLYYRPGSLKARNCAEGREALYAFCAAEEITHERCGKIVVAVDEGQLPALDELERRGRENGLNGITRLTGAELRTYEPHVSGIAGLHVPQTGIVDYTAVTQAFAAKVEQRGGTIRTHAEVQRVERREAGFRLHTAAGAVETRFIVNCAGLHSDRIASMCGVEAEVKIIPFRGEYYKLRPEQRHMVRNLIYPVPDPKFPFLGVHYTRMVDGGVEAGPNAVLAFKREGYKLWDFSPSDMLDTLKFPGFARLARRYWRVGLGEYRRSLSKTQMLRDLRALVPSLQADSIYRAGAGVRAQAVARDGSLLDDFCIHEGEGMVHVLNAPSPAATASLSIGTAVAKIALTHFSV
ncbi:MAG: L-2-hydroxyglutarate oxidase [Desulfuromonadaceae bacterium]|nr:L-2-hydroxyglutarate oxidase [Desulfuromonadaceae bacterium]